MPENGYSQDFGKSEGRRPQSWLSRSEKWTFLVMAFALRQGLKRIAPERPKSGIVLSPAQIDVAPNYLGRCSEQALDAHTVEDALFWHREIIGELAVQIDDTELKLWPASAKATVIKALKDRQQDHAGAVARLSGILRRNERLIWQAWRG